MNIIFFFQKGKQVIYSKTALMFHVKFSGTIERIFECQQQEDFFSLIGSLTCLLLDVFAYGYLRFDNSCLLMLDGSWMFDVLP